MKRSILDYFPAGYTPTELQVRVLLEIERVYHKYRVIVLDGSVALGKSFIAMTVMNWVGGGNYIVPNNILLSQIHKDFPTLPIIKAKDRYQCMKSDMESWTCEKQAKKHGNCPGCPMIKDQVRVNTSKFCVATYFGMYSNRRYNELVIADESHSLIQFFRQLDTKTLAKSVYNWPDPCTKETLTQWCSEERKRVKAKGKKSTAALIKLQSTLGGRSNRYLAYREKDQVNGFPDDVIKVVPAINQTGALFPGHRVNKILMMSATMSDMAMLELGFKKDQFYRISAGSPIPPENRPLVFTRDVSMNWENRADSVRDMCRAVWRICNNHQYEAGIVHVPYSIVKEVYKYLGPYDRFIFHDRDNKKDRLDEFMASKNKVLIASGMSEGISLSYDLAGFNIITKAMFPNNQDTFVKLMTEKFPQWPLEQAVTHLVQAYGRTTRRPDDRSTTYAIDEMLWNLYKNNPRLFPEWIHPAVKLI